MDWPSKVNLTVEKPPDGRLEAGGERVGSGLSRMLDGVTRVVELPANIRCRRTGRPARLMRALCWVCLLFLPALWLLWLILLAIASAPNRGQ